jgi:hypothetical protein
MHTSSARPCRRILLLMALCALFAVAAAVVQAPAAAPQAVPTTAEFLATLAAPAADAPTASLLPAAPKLASTTCTTNADCTGPGQLCCYPCGHPGCSYVCMTVKRCPLIP